MGTANGAFSVGVLPGNAVHYINDQVAAEGTDGITFKASASNSLYGASDKVQPAALQQIPQIKH